MTDRDMMQVTGEEAELGLRCRILTPIMEGNTLGSEDVSSFLSARLSGRCGDGGEPSQMHLS